MPTLDLETVTLMGDYMAKNGPNFNSFTKFEMKLDLLKIEKEAYKKAVKYFNDFENDEDYTVDFDEYECDEESTTDKADRIKAEKEDLIQEFMDSYRTYDAQFWLDYNQFLIDLDILYEELDKEREFSEELSLYADLYEKNGLCYDITYMDPDDDDTDDEGTEYSTTIEFIYKYKSYIDDIVSDLKSGLTSDLFDSLQVQLVSGDKNGTSTTLIQDALKFECLEMASDSSYTSDDDARLCKSSQNIIQFGLT
jgi:hypothetical protein